MNSLSRFADHVYCIARFIIGLMFACHGGQKLLGFPPAAHPGPLDTMGTIGGSIELVCGFLIAFGLLTRVAALIASGSIKASSRWFTAGFSYSSCFTGRDAGVLMR